MQTSRLLDRAAIVMGYREVKPKQRDVIVNLTDVWKIRVCSTTGPTGYGKSFCFMCLPRLYDGLLDTTGLIVVVVVTPLIAITS